MTSQEKYSKLEAYYKTLSTSKKDVCWTCIFRFTLENNYFSISESEIKRSERVVTFFLDILLKYDCSEKKMLFRFLHFCFRWYFKLCSCDDKPREEQYIRAIMRPLRALLADLEVTPSINLEALLFCTVNVQLLTTLSKYGIHIDKSVFHYMNARKIVTDFLTFVQENSVVIHNLSDLHYLTTRVFEEWVNEGNESVCCARSRGHRYVFLIIKTLQVINMSYISSSSALNFMNYVNAFYRTIPDPFVSQEDMKEFLRKIWELSNFQPDYQRVVVGIYERIFENKSPEFYTPRPLKHLCRTFLRRILKKNSKLLPNAVRKLSIPRDLHDYLLCLQP